MNIYLVRHTRVAIPKGICYGNADVDLAHTFAEELIEVKKQLPDIVFDATYSSPLKRCVTLAHRLSTTDIVIDERIREFNFGEWEHLSWDDIYAQDAGKRWFNDYVNVACPGGESFAVMLNRVRNFIRELPDTSKNILIVTHAGIIRAFLIAMQNYSVEQAFDTPVAYGQVFYLKNKLR